MPEDRAWADWIQDLLLEAGYRVTTRPAGADPVSEAMTETDAQVRNSAKTVVVLSQRLPALGGVRRGP